MAEPFNSFEGGESMVKEEAEWTRKGVQNARNLQN